MKNKENKYFKAIDFEAVFDLELRHKMPDIYRIIWITVDDEKYGVEIKGSLLTGLTKVEVFNLKDDTEVDINHSRLLKWANIELDKYTANNQDELKEMEISWFEIKKYMQ